MTSHALIWAGGRMRRSGPPSKSQENEKRHLRAEGDGISISNWWAVFPKKRKGAQGTAREAKGCFPKVSVIKEVLQYLGGA